MHNEVQKTPEEWAYFFMARGAVNDCNRDGLRELLADVIRKAWDLGYEEGVAAKSLDTIQKNLTP